MKFTVVFPSEECSDLSYGLVFIPCPVWIQGRREITNPNPENPYYQPGSFRRLLQTENIASEVVLGKKFVHVIVHQTGNGSQKDLDTLLNDIRSENFLPRLICE